MAGTRRRPDDSHDKLRFWVAAPVVRVWTVSAFVSLYTGDVRVFVAATPLMAGLVSGIALGLRLARGIGNGRS